MLADRDKAMSEEERRQFINQLNSWNDAVVIDPVMIEGGV